MPSENETNNQPAITSDVHGPLEGRYYRVEYWSDDCPRHPVGSQFMWNHTANAAKAASLDHMGEVCFPRGLGVDYDYINVVPAAYVPDEDAYIIDAA